MAKYPKSVCFSVARPNNDLITFARPIATGFNSKFIMSQSSIIIDVHTDENRVPDAIAWKATDTGVEEPAKSKSDDDLFLGWCRKNSFAH